MDAVVLAGGYATRLWPITKHRPKMFLPVGESTVIDRIFAELEADHLATADYEKPVLSVEDTTTESEKFGVVGALAQLVDREHVDDDLLVVAGDNLISFAISDFVDFFQEHAAPTIAAYDVGSHERARSYGLVQLDDDEVVDFQEKPDDPQSTLVSIATYGFPAATLPKLETYLSEDQNPDEPGWFIEWLQSRESVYAYTFDGAWFDIGTPESYLDAVRWALDGENVVAESATLDSVTLGQNVHVMEDVEAVDSSLDSTVVFPDATLRNCTVRDSIIDEQTRLENIDFSGALIGAHTTIANGD